MTESQATEDTAAARAAEQARLRKERREAKIRAGGSSRLNKITGVGGRGEPYFCSPKQTHLVHNPVSLIANHGRHSQHPSPMRLKPHLLSLQQPRSLQRRPPRRRSLNRILTRSISLSITMLHRQPPALLRRSSLPFQRLSCAR
jgi:hypothetical protein